MSLRRSAGRPIIHQVQDNNNGHIGIGDDGEVGGGHLDSVPYVLLGHLEICPDRIVGDDAHHLATFGGGHLGGLECILLLEHLAVGLKASA